MGGGKFSMGEDTTCTFFFVTFHCTEVLVPPDLFVSWHREDSHSQVPFPKTRHATKTFKPYLERDNSFIGNSQSVKKFYDVYWVFRIIRNNQSQKIPRGGYRIVIFGPFELGFEKQIFLWFIIVTELVENN